MPTPESGPWRWFGLDAPVDAWATGRDADQVAGLHESLFRIATEPLDVLPGHPLPGAPSSLFRFVDDGAVRIVFLRQRAAALRLAEVGVSRRDSARMLGVSHQRVQQRVAG